MKVFISWSGGLSHSVAITLRDWLPNVIQSVTPYVSSEDIDKGTRWSLDVAGELSTSFFGILCITEDNLSAPWLNFEAGALSKTIDNSRVCPFLFNIKRSDVDGPILQFQSTVFEKEDFRKLVHGIKTADQECKIDDQRFNSIFDVWWPKLEDALNKLTPTKSDTDGKSKKRQPHEEILEQILELSRQNTRSLSLQEKLLSEAVLSRSIIRSNRESLEGDHPVFRDLVKSFLSLKSIATSDTVSSKELGDSLDRLEAPLSYLCDRLGVPFNDDFKRRWSSADNERFMGRTEFLKERIRIKPDGAK